MSEDKEYRVNLTKLAEVAEKVAQENLELKKKIAKFNQILDGIDNRWLLTEELIILRNELRETLQ